jgi:DNA-binding PucR family transcriptional regulator
VLRLVVAGLRPSGAYTISDVLVEYAVTLNEKVRTDLAAVIRPLRAHKVLWETLTVFVDSDYSRNKAARSLFIHRSTLDYRLRRIGDVTGCDPTSGRGAQMLTAAMIAEALQG